jgi:serine/threonine protein kinase/Tfp pilus assembly protein PilF
VTDVLTRLRTALADQYTIEREVGVGGMSRVFLAEERRFRRKVVVKALPPDLAEEINASRFEREIEIAARLQHPQIVPLFTAGDADGVPFYTMPFIDGETLAARLSRGPLSSRDTIDVLRDVAKALAFAHAQGVIHRDIKPANILLTTGSAVVTDFGVAKALAAAGTVGPERGSAENLRTLTQLGMAIGTPTYMAPEQAAGDTNTDHRADIYAFGCVAFEMLIGSPPFTAGSLAALFAAHLTQKPVDVRERRADVPPSLAELIARCLEKDPVARPRSAAEVLESLERASTELSISRVATPPPRPTDRASIAVLPFKDLAADPSNEHLGIGLADAAITDLASVKALLVRPTSAILPYRARGTDALQAARDLSVDAVVDGSFQRAGNRLRITVQLIEARTGNSLWGTKLTTSLDDIFVMQDEVSHRIVDALEIELTRPERDSLGRLAPVRGDANEAYFRGRLHLFTETLEEANRAIDWFKKALEIDPSFAKAYAGLADAYARMAFTWVPDADWYARAEEMCERALSLDPNLAEGRYLRGRLVWAPAMGFDHAAAMREFAAAMAAQPSLNEVHHWMGIVLLHVSMIEEAAACFERALAINPHDRIAKMNLSFPAYLTGRFQQSLAIAEECGREFTSAWNLYIQALAQIQLGRLDSADQTTEDAVRRFPGEVLFHPVRALTAALRGDRARALHQVEVTVRNQKAFGHYHHAQYDVACVYAQLGEVGLAVQWLTDAARNGFPCVTIFERDPLLAGIRSDARFTSLIADTKTECERYAALYRELRGRMS